MAHVKVTIDAIRKSELGKLKNQAVLILKERGVERFLPIWVSSVQANILSAELQGLPIEQRNAPELFLNKVQLTQSDIIGVTMHCDKEIFYAKLLTYPGDEPEDVKCPIGVALSLAFRNNLPILLNTEIMDKLAIPLSEVRTLGTGESLKSAVNILNSIASEVVYT